MMEKVSFFLPTRKGSTRVPDKNTRPFAGIEGGILAVKLEQLCQSELIAEIILSTNDEKSIEIAAEFDDERLKVIERPESLCLDTTPLAELIRYVPEIVSSDHILWGHATTPMVGGQDYDQMISAYFEGIQAGFDSLVTVKKLQNFLIDPSTSSIINSAKHGDGRWPRTQDLKLLLEVNHVGFISSVANYKIYDDRIGRKVQFFEQDSILSLDIDWEDDFKIAESVYQRMYRG